MSSISLPAMLHIRDDASFLVCLPYYIPKQSQHRFTVPKYQDRTLFVARTDRSYKATRKSQTTKAASTPIKYCSERCRHNKPSEASGSVDRRISDVFIAILDGKSTSAELSLDAVEPAGSSPSKTIKGNQKKVKGETRITVSCDEVEAVVFGARNDPEKVFGRRKNRARRGAPEPKEWKSVDMEDGDDAPNSTYARSDDKQSPRIHSISIAPNLLIQSLIQTPQIPRTTHPFPLKATPTPAPTSTPTR